VALVLIVIVCAGDSVRGGDGRRSGRQQCRNCQQQKFSNHFPPVRPVNQFSSLLCSHFGASLGFVSDL
jgi:hypothetical protein